MPSAQDEAAFMAELLSGIDASAFDGTPSAPASQQRSETAELLRGVEEEADWACDLEPSQSINRHRHYVRCRVESIVRRSYIPNSEVIASAARIGVKEATAVRTASRAETILALETLHRKGEEEEPQRRQAVLRDEWAETSVNEGDIVHLIGEWTEAEQVHSVDDDESMLWAAVDAERMPTMYLASSTIDSSATNLLILHPDVLLSATSVSAVPSCLRKPVLQARLKASSADQASKSDALVMGNMLHAVLQACLTGRSSANEREMETVASCPAATPFPDVWKGCKPTDFSNGFVRAQVKAQVRLSMEELFAVDLDTMTAEAKLLEATRAFGAFAGTFLGEKMNPSATVIDARSQDAPRIRIARVLDVEDDIWSPMYGLKGKVDVSVEVEMEESMEAAGLQRSTTSLPTSTRPPQRSYSTPAARTAVTRGIIPLELKTGRSFNILEHRAQTMLYTLMMGDKYGVDVQAGLLYYSKTGEMHRVRRVKNEVRALIIGRNELAGYLHHGGPEIAATLPPTIDVENTCKRCYAADGCMLYRRSLDHADEFDALDDESPIADLFDRKTSHLTQAHAEFFAKWEQLLAYEEANSVRLKRELWTMTAAAREAQGRCFARMRVAGVVSTKGRVQLRFTRDPSRASLLSGHLSIGDPVTVSLEPSGPLSLGQGFLVDLTPSCVTLSLDRDPSVSLEDLGAVVGAATYRIDKDEMASGMAKIRYNLARLFFAGEAGDERRRRLVVDLEAPRFEGTVDIALPTSLNDDQRSAMRRVLSARDYALVVGMPGTGKTTTIAELIRLLVRQNKSVLLVSYTHSAVDTICRKLVGDAASLLRLGNRDKVHDDVRSHCLGSYDTVEQLEARLMSASIVATTCLSVDSVMFAKRRFDYCIVDEASQVTLPTCVGPLRFADVSVLVGDPLQLPPLVRDERAKRGGLETSLFSRLADAHPQAMVYLSSQYRMNADIMALSNRLVYDGRLRCGSEKVASLSLPAPHRKAALQRLHMLRPSQRSSCWLSDVLDPANRVLFLDTDEIPNARESMHGRMTQNEAEADIVRHVCSALVLAGTDLNDVAVITPLRQQLKLITSVLGHNAGGVAAGLGSSPSKQAEAAPRIEVITADRAQGRDKAVVVMSFVRSNRAGADGKGNIGDLLADARRINVALTRAQRKLILIGSRSTLRASPLLAEMLDLLDERRWIYMLPADALECHGVPDGRWRALAPVESPSTKRKANATDENAPPSSAPTLGARKLVITSPTSLTQPRRKFARTASSCSTDVLPPSSSPVSPTKGKGKRQRGLDSWLSSRPVLRDVLNDAG